MKTEERKLILFKDWKILDIIIPMTWKSESFTKIELIVLSSIQTR